MKNLLRTACLALCLTASTEALADFKRIADEESFRALVVGKKLFLGKNSFTIRKNGRLSGTFDGKTVKGVWAWRDGFWCRTLSKPRENTDCQTWEVDGKSFRVKRERGKGASFTYTLK